MHRDFRPHRLTVLMICAVISMVFFPATSSDTSIPTQLPPPPSAEEMQTLEELVRWVQGGQDRSRLDLGAGARLSTVIRDQPRSFELFRSYNVGEARHRLLAEVPYGDLIDLAATRHGVDALLLAAMVRAESSFDPSVVSSQGALGLMQLMPETARRFGASDPFDPAHNVAAGARYFSRLLERFQGDLELALAAYNAGPGAVLRYGGVPPYRETKAYVERVLVTYVDFHRRLWRDTEAGELLSR